MEHDFYKKHRLRVSRDILGNEWGDFIDLSGRVRRLDERKEHNVLVSREYENAGLDLLKNDLCMYLNFQDKRTFFDLQERLKTSSPITMELFDSVIRLKREILSRYLLGEYLLRELDYLHLRSRVVWEKVRSTQDPTGTPR